MPGPISSLLASYIACTFVQATTIAWQQSTTLQGVLSIECRYNCQIVPFTIDWLQMQQSFMLSLCQVIATVLIPMPSLHSRNNCCCCSLQSSQCDLTVCLHLISIFHSILMPMLTLTVSCWVMATSGAMRYGATCFKLIMQNFHCYKSKTELQQTIREQDWPSPQDLCVDDSTLLPYLAHSWTVLQYKQTDIISHLRTVIISAQLTKWTSANGSKESMPNTCRESQAQFLCYMQGKL